MYFWMDITILSISFNIYPRRLLFYPVITNEILNTCLTHAQRITISISSKTLALMLVLFHKFDFILT